VNSGIKQTFRAKFIASELRLPILVHKNILSGSSLFLRRKLEFGSNMSVRQDCLLQYPRIKLELGKKAFSFFGPEIYNALPLTIKGNSLLSLRYKIKEIYF
jgi:hypothetical protein